MQFSTHNVLYNYFIKTNFPRTAHSKLVSIELADIADCDRRPIFVYDFCTYRLKIKRLPISSCSHLCSFHTYV